MSVQSARDFLKRIETDQALKDRLEGEADLEARQQIIKEAGFNFTLSEYKQVVEELAAVSGRQLTPEELQQVAGGLGRRFGDRLFLPQLSRNKSWRLFKEPSASPFAGRSQGRFPGETGFVVN